MHGLKTLSKSHKVEKKKEKVEPEAENKQFQKILTVSLLFGIILVAGYIGFYYYHYNISEEEDYVGFGILNHREEAEDYPTVAYVDQYIGFFVTVENELSHDLTFKVRVLKGDNLTELSSDGSKYATHLYSTDKETLEPKKEWQSDELFVSFSELGSNQIIIVELWEYTTDGRDFYDILWLRLKIIPYQQEQQNQ